MEPEIGTPDNEWEDFIRLLIERGRFTSRKLSWVCSHGPYFLKIPRNGNKTTPSLDEAEGRSLAKTEFDQTQQLAAIDQGVNRPLKLIQSCIVNRNLEGPDLWILAKQQPGSPVVQTALEECAGMVGRIHRNCLQNLLRLPVYEYETDPFLAAGDEVLTRLKQRSLTIVAEGYEVRNFKREADVGRWKFFDPHRLVLGVPEDDFTRFVLSVLMINWGCNKQCKAWNSFDYRALMEAYQAAREEPLDPILISYTFNRNYRMRRWWARRSIREMHGLRRLGGYVYEMIYFSQIKRWSEQHGI